MKELKKKISPLSGMITIGELSLKTDLKIVTIRYYERLGLLPDPRPKDSLRNRMYSDSYVDRLFFIKKTRELGFSLGEVSDMIKWVEKRKKIPKKRLSKKIFHTLNIIDKQVRDLKALRKELYSLLS